jgi:hypothetical protein
MDYLEPRFPAVAVRTPHYESVYLRASVTIVAPVERCVGWEYADPSGATHHVRSCSNAGTRLGFSRGDETRTLATTYGAVYELGAPEPHAGLVVQPFPDG